MLLKAQNCVLYIVLGPILTWEVKKIAESEKLWSGKLGNMRYFYSSSMQKIAGRWSDFRPEKFYFEIFPKTNAVSITFGPRYNHGQSLKEIDFLTRNAVDRF